MATKVTTEDWIEELKSISCSGSLERIKALEEEFGVSATAVAAAAPAAGAPGGAEDGGAEESATVDVVLTAAGDKKIQVIKAVRATRAWDSRTPRHWSTRRRSPSRRASSARRPVN